MYHPQFNCVYHQPQESIPLGCVLPVFVVYGGGLGVRCTDLDMDTLTSPPRNHISWIP